MLKLTNGMILYHGSYCEVSHPELQKCAKQKDFGQGFYLTSSREQAISFLNTSISKAITKGDITEKLKDQYCFKTEKALACLRFIGGEKIWLKK